MIRIFRTIENTIQQVSEGSEGCWIALTAPTAAELIEIASDYHIDIDHCRHSGNGRTKREGILCNNSMRHYHY